MGDRTTFFTIDRKLLEDELWTSEPFTKGQAWVDLIGRASYKDTEELQRGELLFTERELADRWRWPDPKVRRFLQWLEKEGMITRSVVRSKNRSGKRSKINVEKYSIYQDLRSKSRSKNRSKNEVSTYSNKTIINNINQSLNTPDGVREELVEIFGEKAEQLIEDVRVYYEAHPEKDFPGWKQAALQFNANQKRWAKPKKGSDPMSRAIGAFMEEAE
jgi:hypothetical protein